MTLKLRADNLQVVKWYGMTYFWYSGAEFNEKTFAQTHSTMISLSKQF